MGGCSREGSPVPVRSIFPAPSDCLSRRRTGERRGNRHAAGNDHDNLNDEYVTFENTGSGTLDLSGWTVEDAADHTYVVPSGVTLESGATITLYTGSGTDTETALYWDSGSAIWHNGGDTIFVYDDSGSLRLEVSY